MFGWLRCWLEMCPCEAAVRLTRDRVHYDYRCLVCGKVVPDVVGHPRRAGEGGDHG